MWHWYWTDACVNIYKSRFSKRQRQKKHSSVSKNLSQNFISFVFRRNIEFSYSNLLPIVKNCGVFLSMWSFTNHRLWIKFVSLWFQFLWRKFRHLNRRWLSGFFSRSGVLWTSVLSWNYKRKKILEKNNSSSSMANMTR